MNPMDMLKEAGEAKVAMKANHAAQIAALTRIAELLEKILAALSAPAPEEVK